MMPRLRKFNITTKSGEEHVIYVGSKEEAEANTLFGTVVEAEEIELQFEAKISSSVDEVCYFKRMDDFSKLILRAFPECNKVVFDCRGVWVHGDNAPRNLWHAVNSKEVLSFIDGYWETIGLQFNIKHNEK